MRSISRRCSGSPRPSTGSADFRDWGFAVGFAVLLFCCFAVGTAVGFVWVCLGLLLVLRFCGVLSFPCFHVPAPEVGVFSALSSPTFLRHRPCTALYGIPLPKVGVFLALSSPTFLRHRPCTATCPAAVSVAVAPSRCEPFLAFPLLPGPAARPAAVSVAVAPSRCEPFLAFPLLPGPAARPAAVSVAVAPVSCRSRAHGAKAAWQVLWDERRSMPFR